jgi:hypothetical protein
MNSLLPTCLDILGSISPIHSQKCAGIRAETSQPFNEEKMFQFVLKGRQNWNDGEGTVCEALSLLVREEYSLLM